MNGIIIKGHQRSGNNYLIHLVGLNLFPNYKEYDFSDGNDHCILNNLQPDTKYLYVFRNKKDTLLSLFNQRCLYGLRVDDLVTFLNTKYCKMYDPTIKTNINYSTTQFTKTYENINNFFFCCIDKTPEEWYDFHLQEYRKFEGDNLLFVSYDNLKDNFTEEMDKVSFFLTGTKAGNYKNIGSKMGWYL